MIREMIVVEGKGDTAAIQRAVQADTIETRGSAIDEEIMARIRLAQARRGVIIFTDPDYAGERIRSKIIEQVPDCKHAFLPQEAAMMRGDIGIEHAAPEVIRQALNDVRSTYEGFPSQISWSDLWRCGLVNHPDAAKRRMIMGQAMGIGYGNGKTFYKRCHMFQISREEFEQAYQHLLDIEGVDR